MQPPQCAHPDDVAPRGNKTTELAARSCRLVRARVFHRGGTQVSGPRAFAEAHRAAEEWNHCPARAFQRLQSTMFGAGLPMEGAASGVLRVQSSPRRGMPPCEPPASRFGRLQGTSRPPEVRKIAQFALFRTPFGGYFGILVLKSAAHGVYRVRGRFLGVLGNPGIPPLAQDAGHGGRSGSNPHGEGSIPSHPAIRRWCRSARLLHDGRIAMPAPSPSVSDAEVVEALGCEPSISWVRVPPDTPSGIGRGSSSLGLDPRHLAGAIPASLTIATEQTESRRAANAPTGFDSPVASN